MSALLPVLLPLACLLSPLTQAPAPSPSRDPEEYARFLEGGERVARMQVPRVVDAIGVKPGDRVADLGSGSGLFSRPIAQRVGPTGVVYAVDVEPGLLTVVARSAKEAGLTNLRTVLAAGDDSKIPEPVDLIFVCDTLHHIPDQGPYLKRLVRHLKPGGRLVLIDFDRNWPRGHESMVYAKTDLEAWVTGAGLTLVASHDWLENSYFHVYQRK
jgi:ubiquinone/menaquinone biosynthesis C-methylase UbiE